MIEFANWGLALTALCVFIGICAGIVASVRYRSDRQYRREWMKNMYNYQYGAELRARGIKDPCAEEDAG